MGYEFRNNTDPLTVIKQLRATSEKQSKHLAEALKEKNNAHELLDIERRRHERHMNDLQREASRRLASVVEVNTRNEYLMSLIASANYLQPPAPIVIESKELFERNQSLQKENEFLRKENNELTQRNTNQISYVQQYRDEADKLRAANQNQYDTIQKMRHEDVDRHQDEAHHLRAANMDLGARVNRQRDTIRKMSASIDAARASLVQV